MTIEKMLEANKKAKEDAERIFQSDREDKFEILRKRLYDSERFAYAQDSELSMVINMCDCYMAEKQFQRESCFDGINSFKEAVIHYRKTRFVIYRIEQNLSDYDIEDGYQYLVEKKVPVSFLMFLLKMHTVHTERIALRFARLYKEHKDYVNTFRLLKAYSEKYPENTDMKLELADTYLLASKIEDALDVLKTIKEPTGDVLELIKGLDVIKRGERNGDT